MKTTHLRNSISDLLVNTMLVESQSSIPDQDKKRSYLHKLNWFTPKLADQSFSFDISTISEGVKLMSVESVTDERS